MRPGMPLGRAHATVGRSCERLRRAAGALGRRGADALVARGKAVVEAAQEAVSAASGRQVIAVGCDTGDDQSVRDMVLAVTDGLGGVDIPVNAAARPDTGTVAGIDAFEDSEFSEQINAKVLGTGTTRRAAAARTRPGRRARDEPQHRLASPATAPRRRTAGVPARPRHHRRRDPAARRRAHPGPGTGPASPPARLPRRAHCLQTLRVHCHVLMARGWPFSYFSSGRGGPGNCSPGHPTSGPI